ncbi:MAG: hypothetical protein FWE24_02420 [Defluviitaleaceae bacterium]|nr:hypothetical protein [Defluviitaleaceae bacterium]
MRLFALILAIMGVLMLIFNRQLMQLKYKWSFKNNVEPTELALFSRGLFAVVLIIIAMFMFFADI